VKGGGESMHLPDMAALFAALEEFMRVGEDARK
jgi:hypothetical protein